MKIAIITGASSGMGREFVLQLDRAQEYEEIWVIARRLDRLESLTDEVRAKLRPISLDLTAAVAGKAAGGYDTLEEASAAMNSVSDLVYRPNPEASAVYDKLFAEYKLLHDYFGRGGNDVMMRLRDIASAAN